MRVNARQIRESHQSCSGYRSVGIADGGYGVCAGLCAGSVETGIGKRSGRKAPAVAPVNLPSHAEILRIVGYVGRELNGLCSRQGRRSAPGRNGNIKHALGYGDRRGARFRRIADSSCRHGDSCRTGHIRRRRIING